MCMVEDIGDRIGEAIGEGRWLTYTELAEIRGIGRESAVKLAQRERWRKLSGNSPDRTVRGFVPTEWLKPAKGERIGETLGGLGEVFPDVSGELSRLVSGLQDTMSFVRERAEAAEARADAAEAARRTAEARADAAERRTDLADADRRVAEGRADTERTR